MQGKVDPGSAQITELARSFSYKLNLGRYDPSRQYESMDFFCSQKAECTFDDAAAVSAALHKFCKAQVIEAVREAIREIKGGK